MSEGSGTSVAPPGTAGTGALLAVILGAVLVPLNSTMIAVALPDISRELDVDRGATSVLVVVYLVMMLAGQPVAGRVVDRVGARRTLVAGLAGLGAMSLAAAFAGTFTLLVVARMAQAAFAAMLQPSIQSMLRALTSRDRRGRTFGILGSAASSGAALGPIIGGLVVAAAGWPAVFLVNLPVVALVLVLLRRVPETASTRTPSASSAASSSAMPGRVRNPVFAAAFAVQATSTLAQYALLLTVPVILDDRGWGSAAVGAALTTLTIGSIVIGPPGGRAGDRYGSRLPAAIGAALSAVSVVVLAAAGAGAAPAVMVAAITVFGFGFGLSAPNLMTAALESVPENRTGAAGGVFATARYVGSIPSSILFGLLVDQGTDGTGAVLTVAAVSTIAALVLSRGLPGPDRRSAPS